jgi:hypothetical protein
MILDQESAKALDSQHRAELRALTERDALVATEQLLAMAATARWPAEKDCSHGLVERQRLLYRIGK